MRKNQIILFLLILTSVQVWSQPGLDASQYSMKQLQGLAKNSERLGDYYTALDMYLKCLDKKKDDKSIQEKIAILYEKTRDYQNAYTAWRQIYEDDSTKNMMALYHKSTLAMNLEKYNEARKGFERFKDLYNSGDNEKVMKKLCDANIKGCLSVQGMRDSAKSIEMTIKHLDKNINKAHAELSPIPISSKMFYFSSMNLDSLKYFPFSDTVQKPVRQFYMAERSGKPWINKGHIDEPFNIAGTNVGNGVFSIDKNRFYFTRCEENRQRKLICNLCVCKRDSGSSWGRPIVLPDPINNPEYTTTHPAIGEDSKKKREILYFVSDRPGTKGKMDIWYSEYNAQKNEYSAPKNAGMNINSVEDEITPFYDNTTKTLFFSSNSYPGIGGLDIFRATGELKKWSSPRNIGLPINSSADDLYYTHGDNSEYGFFVSNRTGGVPLKNPTCCDDIYHFVYDNLVRVHVTGKVLDVAENAILEKFNRKFNLKLELNRKSKPVKNVPITLYLQDLASKQSFIIQKDTTDKSGRYAFTNLEANKNYYVFVSNYGYFDRKISFNTKGYASNDTLRLKPTKINYIPEVTLQLKIQYGFNQSILNDTARRLLDTTLLEILNDLPNIIVEISSHTDDIGDETYNQDLSQKRADEVLKYLVQRGINPMRLFAVGYGESKPIFENSNADGSDNPVNREKNRRTEIRIVGSLRENAYNNEDDTREIKDDAAFDE